MDMITVKACLTLLFVVAFVLARKGEALSLALAIVSVVLFLQVLATQGPNP
jgi:hypothetical protein